MHEGVVSRNRWKAASEWKKELFQLLIKSIAAKFRASNLT